ncbi:hypothetical protein F3Y22_tig00112498pilonHSYRG00060 [Hibiscus syriacus]|uniref:Uncharacterized protein n=1 Tax=Hibiscus syriacus TaxID=106335 RepID=A0A6A2WY30_HIBSY|nr:hypothetical protein F3Y22_tig00112498pilonHSYRG00060 [Hibiscus syriacus]
MHRGGQILCWLRENNGFERTNFWGNVYPTFVALPYLQQTNGRIIVNSSLENCLPLPRMSLYAEYILLYYGIIITCKYLDSSDFTGLIDRANCNSNQSNTREPEPDPDPAARAALVNFYYTLNLEVNHEVGITMQHMDGSEAKRREENLCSKRELRCNGRKNEKYQLNSNTSGSFHDIKVQASGGPVEEFVRLIVSVACRGDAYVKYPSWHDSFLLFRMVGVVSEGSTVGYMLTSSSPRKLPAGPSIQQKSE